jgi:hypothetical protein
MVLTQVTSLPPLPVFCWCIHLISSAFLGFGVVFTTIRTDTLEATAHSWRIGVIKNKMTTNLVFTYAF